MKLWLKGAGGTPNGILVYLLLNPKPWTSKSNLYIEPKKAEPKKLNPKVQLLGSEFGFRLQFPTSGLEKKVHILGLGTRFTIRCNIMCSMVHVAIVRTRHASATRESRHDGASWSYTTSRVSFMRVGDATATRRCALCVYREFLTMQISYVYVCRRRHRAKQIVARMSFDAYFVYLSFNVSTYARRMRVARVDVKICSILTKTRRLHWRYISVNIRRFDATHA